VGGLGHGCTNYDVFGVKGLGGIGCGWGLDRNLAASGQLLLLAADVHHFQGPTVTVILGKDFHVNLPDSSEGIPELPKFEESDAMGRAGVHELGLLISKMKWIFREQPVSDTGIDAYIEPCDQSGTATGRLIGCQIKSGPSYFREETPSIVPYRTDSEHLAYWLGHSLPVLVVLRDEDSGRCYWQVVNEKTAINTGKGWKLDVPKAQVLSEESKPQLLRIADTGWLERSRTFTTPDKFFRRIESNPLFDYDQGLQGRKASLSELQEFLKNNNAIIAVLTGRGGIGKSKLIRQWLSDVSDWTFLFKKQTVPVSTTTEQELSGDRYIIIVDDAHRQADIDALLQLVRGARESGKTIKVLLSCRPIGIQRLDAALSRSFDLTAVVRLKELKRLSDPEVHALAAEVLGPENQHLVPFLARVSRDTPLVTVIGGRLIRRKAVPVNALAGAEDFKRAVFDKFLDEVETVARHAPKQVRPLLYLISALQPLALREGSVNKNCATFLKWEPFEVSQSVDELESFGLLVRSGRKYRIAPDMFADFLLEQASLGPTGTPNGYADAVYRGFGNEYLANLLQNFAELDFRIVGQGQTSLLTSVWKDLRSKFDEAGSYEKLQLLKSIESAAFYQPDPVMELIRLVMQISPSFTESSGSSEIHHNNSRQEVLDALPILLRAVAYQPAYRDEAVRRLWSLAKHDSRRPNSYPRQALRVLKQLAAYSRYKPVEVNLEIAKIFRDLSAQDDFSGTPSPFDIVDVLLEREAEENETVGMTMVLSSYGLSYAVIAPVRKLCLQTLQEALGSDSASKASHAFRSLSRLIHGFLPRLGRTLSDDEKRWHAEERKYCLAILAERLEMGSVPLPLAQEVKATLVSFIARGQNDETNESVRSVLALLPTSPTLDAFDVFCSGESDIRDLTVCTVDAIDEARARNRQRGREAANVFRASFGTADECISELARFYVQARDCNIEMKGANEFVGNLCADLEFLTQLAGQIRDGRYEHELAHTAQAVLRKLREHPGPDYRTTALAAARSDDLTLVRSAAAGMWGMNYYPATDDDLEILDELSHHNDWRVRDCVIWALSIVGKHPAREQDAIERILAFSAGKDKKVADRICDAFLYSKISIANLSEAQFDRLLGILLPVPDLDEHGIGLVLNWGVTNRPSALIRFIKKRIETATERALDGDWSYRVVPGHSNKIYLNGLQNAAELSGFRADILKEIERGNSIRDELINLFWQVTVLDDQSFDLLRPWFHSGDVIKFTLAVRVLNGTSERLAFSHKSLVLEIIEAAEKLGGDNVERVIESLISNVHPSFFSGLGNEQPPAIVELRTTADKELADPQLHPLMLRLYQQIRDSANTAPWRFPAGDDEEEEF
jgi:hypothetical protein